MAVLGDHGQGVVVPSESGNDVIDDRVPTTVRTVQLEGIALQEEEEDVSWLKVWNVNFNARKCVSG